MVYGTFVGEGSADERRAVRPATYVALAAGALVVTALVLIAMPPTSGASALENINRDDGTDALVNAVLVARGDSLPTKLAASSLAINPSLPFRGSSILHAPRRMASVRGSLKQSRIQALAGLDPTTQFCSDPTDCLRNNDYFIENAKFHQAARDMTEGLEGPALPPNLPEGYAWCDPDNSDC